MVSDVTLDSIIAAQSATIAELQRAIKSLAAGHHDITITEDRQSDDWYARCSCGALSHPLTYGYASQWRCPRAVAEAEVDYHRARYEDRKRSMEAR